jgi:signal transduction histidine kinase
MILGQGGRAATGAESEAGHMDAHGRRMHGDRRAGTARRRRRRADREAHATLPAFTELTAGIAHDLNNRLAVILGQAQLLQRGIGGDPATISRRLDKIEEETLRASRMTRGLLDLARRSEPRHEAVSINTLVPRALAMIHARLRGREITVQTDLSDRMPLVRGDADQLTQILQHLMSNAIDAMEDTGTLTVATAVTDDALELTVSDTGVGMDEERASHIFEPFYTTKPDGEGTGLGLFLTLAILKTHGGNIAVESAPRCGTTMRVRLPRPLTLAQAPSSTN